MAESLKDKVIRGALWNGTEKFGTTLLLFVSNLILARLLSPDDFGCVGILMVFVSLADTVVDGGFSSALVQKEQVTDADNSTILIWNIVVSLSLYVILFLIAPTIASFYDIELLADVLRVQGLVLFFNGLSIIQKSQLQRKMLFKKLATINLSAAMAGSVAGIILAFMGMGVWSLVVKLLVSSIMASLLFWMDAERFPHFIFSKQAFENMVGFGSFMTLNGIFNNLYHNALSLVIGKCMSPATLGYFTQARKLEDVPRQAISSVVTHVSFPAFSHLQTDNTKFRDALRKSFSVLGYVNFAFSILLMIVAKPLVVTLLTAKWIPCVPYFRVVCLYGIVMGFIDLFQSAIVGLGRSTILFYTGAFYKSIGLVLVLFGTLWGMNGILLGFIIGYVVGLVVLSFVIRRLVDYRVSLQFWDILACAWPAICSGVLTFFLRKIVVDLSDSSQLFVLSTFYVTVFIVLTSCFRVKSGMFLKEQAFRLYFNGHRR